MKKIGRFDVNGVHYQVSLYVEVRGGTHLPGVWRLYALKRGRVVDAAECGELRTLIGMALDGFGKDAKLPPPRRVRALVTDAPDLREDWADLRPRRRPDPV